ncbi:2,3-bisphosphoglycerate-independent phosphoglycerate mutase [uncultured Cytophaga sp.]|uniref:2,3-bisphosphoglycerate-independent phosphoglycerate mutase n=1 Tax=uncultured Cytophaga sp. TaxID=160238 RepID=UPI00262228CE|nr:2,3-bisphosphoglycerate-independent phosphoglycerate mutase [uncultured Cytophaga sp.]
MNKKVILMILDGWGLGTNPKVSAIAAAKTPFVDSLFLKYPHSKLEASGLAVGLPVGQMGNSEVGHMNIGAGRIVYQDLVKINLAVENNTLADEPAIKDAFNYAKSNNKKVHFIGLVSDGGVHSHVNHVKGLCTIAHQYGLKDVFVHAFTDGRDCDPKSGLGFVQELEASMAKTTGKIASIVGRYFAMDRDNRWERVKLAYDVMVHGEGAHATDALKAIQNSYNEGVTDEFIKPVVIVDSADQPIAKIEQGDVVICFNFRTDRGREITVALTQKDFHEQNMFKQDLYYVTMTNYDDTFKGVKVIFDKDNLSNTLGEVLEAAGKKQIRIAETEKYPHVTFFFSGGREQPFNGEKRLMAASPKVATYDLAPEMSANEIKEKIVAELISKDPDFVVLNFANPDMVGHTGVFEAAVKACEVVDGCTEAVVTTALENGYTAIVIADHGNADFMINEDGTPNTAHTTNLVPCILIDKTHTKPLKNGKLGDLAPTILELMGVAKPKEMTGESLL